VLPDLSALVNVGALTTLFFLEPGLAYAAVGTGRVLAGAIRLFELKVEIFTNQRTF
jgi:hypothetical protein